MVFNLITNVSVDLVTKRMTYGKSAVTGLPPESG